VQVASTSLHTKPSAGLTPLALAFSLNRVTAARTLIAAGADQTTRDQRGNNLLRILLCGIKNKAANRSCYLKDMLALIDRRLIPSLLTEGSREGPGAATPLARWLDLSNTDYNYHGGDYGRGHFSNRNNETEDKINVPHAILEFSTHRR